jgi:hypothetical protein
MLDGEASRRYDSVGVEVNMIRTPHRRTVLGLPQFAAALSIFGILLLLVFVFLLPNALQ